jgi:ubiquitin fusion degradation protein 1
MDWGSSFVPRRQMETTFQAHYNCQSTALAGRDVTEGDKIFLPPSALDRLARMNVEYPMLFEITAADTGKRTHCGVLEFSAEEGFCYLPYWMMENLAVWCFHMIWFVVI